MVFVLKEAELMDSEHVQKMILFLLEQTKNRPPTEPAHVGVNARALTLATQERGSDGWMEKWRI